MRLETKRLILREYTYDDFQSLQEIITDKETMKYYSQPYDLNGVKRWIDWNLDNYKTFGFGLFALELKENGKMIGDCGITMQKINGKIKPEIGYHINKNYHNRGYATEAAKLCKNFIFENTTFNEIYTYMNAENISSSKVAIKNGMKLVDEYEDDEEKLKVYCITRKEWEKESKN